MQRQATIADADQRLVAALGARAGRASPGELREATGLPRRTITRALGRLDGAGLLADRSKSIVTLSARGWFLLEPLSASGAEHRVAHGRRTQRAGAFKASTRGDELPRSARSPETDPEFDLDEEEQLDGDENTLGYEDELGESQATDARGGFWAGFVKGL